MLFDLRSNAKMPSYSLQDRNEHIELVRIFIAFLVFSPLLHQDVQEVEVGEVDGVQEPTEGHRGVHVKYPGREGGR
jgi:hypothetical protein